MQTIIKARTRDRCLRKFAFEIIMILKAKKEAARRGIMIAAGLYVKTRTFGNAVR